MLSLILNMQVDICPMSSCKFTSESQIKGIVKIYIIQFYTVVL